MTDSYHFPFLLMIKVKGILVLLKDFFNVISIQIISSFLGLKLEIFNSEPKTTLIQD